MIDAKLKIGARVAFRIKVFRPPYTPYYDFYKGHTFEIIAWHHGDTHIELKCISDPSIHVNGYVHPDELKLV